MAQHVDTIMTNLKNYANLKLTAITEGDPFLSFIKPVVERVINNNFYKVESFLKQISDKDGLVDINGILSEMASNLINSKPFKIESGLLKGLEIGSGKIKMDIPYFNKSIILNEQDLNELKEILNRQ